MFTSSILGEVSHPTNCLKEYQKAFKNRCQATILSWFDSWGDWAWTTTRSLAEQLKYHRDTICTHLNRLVDAGILERRPAKRWPTDKAFEYRINSAQLLAHFWLRSFAETFKRFNLAAIPLLPLNVFIPEVPDDDVPPDCPKPTENRVIRKFRHRRQEEQTWAAENSDSYLNPKNNQNLSLQTASSLNQNFSSESEEEEVEVVPCEVVSISPDASEELKDADEDEFSGSMPKNYDCRSPKDDPRYFQLDFHEQEAVESACEIMEDLVGRLTPGLVWLAFSKSATVILDAMIAARNYAHSQRCKGQRISRPIGLIKKAIEEEWKPNQPVESKGTNGAWREYQPDAPPLEKLMQMYGEDWEEAALHFGFTQSDIAQTQRGKSS